MLGAVQLRSSRHISGGRVPCTQIDPHFHSAFAGLTSVGACVEALLGMPAEDRSAPGPRSEAGALQATVA